MKFIHRTLDKVEVPRVPVRVSPDFRIVIVTGIAAVASLIVSTQGKTNSHAPEHLQVLAYAGGAGFLVFGILCVRSLAAEIYRVIGARTGPGHAGVLRWLILLIGYALVGLTFLDLIQVKAIHQLLIGGAVTGIVLGIAAQQSLGNLFAGIVLLLARPFNVGDRIRVRSGSLGGETIGEVTGMGLTYVTLMTLDGPLSLPNAGVLAAGIGPATEEQAARAAAEAKGESEAKIAEAKDAEVKDTEARDTEARDTEIKDTQVIGASESEQPATAADPPSTAGDEQQATQVLDDELLGTSQLN